MFLNDIKCETKQIILKMLITTLQLHSDSGTKHYVDMISE